MRGSVSNKLINHKLQLLSAIGVDTQAIIQACNINPVSIKNDQLRTAEDKFRRFLALTNQYNQCASVQKGMTSIHDFYPLFSDMFNLALNESTPKNALESLLRYRFIVGDCDTFTLKTTDNKLILEYVNTAPKVPVNSAMGNFVLFKSVLHQLLSNFKVDISFDNSVTINQKLTNEQLQTHCVYHQNKNLMVITSDQINARNESHNPFLHQLQVNTLERLKRSICPVQSFAAETKALIENLTHNQVYSDVSVLEEVCHLLGMSRWTLNKKLARENTSFSVLLKLSRLEKSSDLLESTDKSIREISELCNFSSQAAFAKFFRQNHCMSPVQYREKSRRIQ